MLFVLILVTFFFLILNFYINNFDFFHPSTLFIAIFFVCEVMCGIGANYYSITIHLNTALVLITGFFAFTVLSVLSKPSEIRTLGYKCEVIKLSNIYSMLLIVIEILAIVFFIKYLKSIANAWGAGGGSLSDMINLYDVMTKFWKTTFSNLNVPVPMVYRIANPILEAGVALTIYVAVNNFVVAKKIDILHIIIIALDVVLIILNGSRSPLFRLFTMIFILFYIMMYRSGKIQHGDLRVLFRLLKKGLVFILAMFAVLYLIGRGDKLHNLLDYFFIYTGAPIVNLDTFLQSEEFGMGGLFGEQTFKSLYSYLGKILDISDFKYSSISIFTFSSNGIELGNVHTTYQKFIYDFSYIGVLPLISIVALYYVVTYNSCKKNISNSVIDFKLLIFAYLYNDLVMLFFSNRFFETTLDGPFIKLLILSFVLREFLFEHRYVKIYIKMPIIKINL